MRRKFGFLALAASTLGACTSTPPLRSTAELTVTSMDALPAPSRSDLSAKERPYLIGPFDKITVDVFGVAELSKEIQADASGRISLPLVGVIEAAGRTPEELASAIAGQLRGRYVRDPQVTVNLKETVSQVVTIDGEVREPGLYPVIGRMTLSRVVATAKGATEFAKLSDVVIFRSVNGQRMAALYDLKSIRRGLYADPEVFANDTVIVGNSQARRIFRDVLQASPIITAPLIALANRN